MPIGLTRLSLLARSLALVAAFMLLPVGDSFAVATAIYRGDEAAGKATGKRHELRLRSDGTATWIIDHRNNRAPVIEEGRWYPISVEEFDLIVETRDGKPVDSGVVRFVKQGDEVHTTPENADRFGAQGLSLKHAKSATPAAGPAAMRAGASSPIGLWQWQGQVASAEPLVVDQPDHYTLEIQSGGKVLVRADCNRGSATYRMEGRTILFKLGGFTRAACPEGSHDRHFLKMLESVVAQRTRGDTLFLDLPADGGSLRFARVR